MSKLSKFQKLVLDVILLIFFMSFTYYCISTVTYIQEAKANIKYDITKFQLSPKQIARKYNAKLLVDIKTKKATFFDTKGNIIYAEYIRHFNKIGELYIYKTYIGIKNGNYIYFFDIFYNLKSVFKNITYLLPFFVLGMLFLLYDQKKSIEDETLMKIANIEALATGNSLIVLTENIHHELNTPLDVLKHNVNRILEKLERDKEKCKGSCDVNLHNLINETRYYIDLSFEQIESILKNMKEFKSIRYSNGNKSIYDILEASVKMIKITSGDTFDYYVDEKLKNYVIDHDCGMKNADLMNVVINNIKNSIEANATKIEFLTFNEDIKHKKIGIIIKDDGNGIPEEMRETLFAPNSSTKGEGGLRGNGMFLNKKLLKSFGGDEKLYWSEVNQGTEILLIVPAQKK